MNISIKIVLHVEKTFHINNHNMVSYLSCNLKNRIKANTDFFFVSSIMGIDGCTQSSFVINFLSPQ